MDQTEVLIVGAGPTGIMLGLELALQDIAFRIIDSSLIRSDKSRALVLQSRSLELLDRHGIVDELTAQGSYNMGVRLFANRKPVFEIELGGNEFKDTMFPHPLMISQATTEQVLDEALLKYGKKVERLVTAEKLEQDAEGVKVTVRNADGSESQIWCKYVVGCDGAHSIVRKSAGLTFEGAAYPQDCILADVELKWEQKRCLSIFMGDGFMAIFPMKNNIFRLICTRPYDADDDREPTIKDFETKVAQLVPGVVEIENPVWLARFRLHHRIAESFRAGRMFVAGDSAHIHSPAGGQGMNTGIQDAVNLGWKLASVLRGEESDLLLDSYNIERHKVGQNLLKGTDRLFEFMATTNPLYLFLRNTLVPWIAPIVMSDPARRANRFRFVSQLGIRYRNSPIVGQSSLWTGKLQGGDRAPDSILKTSGGQTTILGLCKELGFHLLLFSGLEDAAVDEATLEAAELEFYTYGGKAVKVHRILNSDSANAKVYSDLEGMAHGFYQLDGPAYVLVRPDGHISFIGPLSAMDDLVTWMKK